MLQILAAATAICFEKWTSNCGSGSRPMFSNAFLQLCFDHVWLNKPICLKSPDVHVCVCLCVFVSVYVCLCVCCNLEVNYWLAAYIILSTNICFLHNIGCLGKHTFKESWDLSMHLNLLLMHYISTSPEKVRHQCCNKKNTVKVHTFLKLFST